MLTHDRLYAEIKAIEEGVLPGSGSEHRYQ